MKDWNRVKLELEAEKKSGWIASLLNLVIPGAGYMYCRRIILGTWVFLLSIAFQAGLMGAYSVPDNIEVVYGGFVLVIVVDGFLCAERYNKKALTLALAQNHSNHNTLSVDNLEELAKLAELKDKGAITEEEFQSQKSKLLS